MTRPYRGSVLVLAAGVLAGCTGDIAVRGEGGSDPGGEEPGSPASPTTRPGTPGVPAGTPGTSTPGARCTPGAEGRLRRLTRAELNAAFRDLFGDGSAPANALDLEPQVGAFYNSYADLWVDKRFLDRYRAIAGEVAGRAAARLRALVSCDLAADEARCLRTVITGLGERIFRQPVGAEVERKLTALYQSLRAAGTAEESVQGLLQAMLMMPEFLYRSETLIGRQGEAGEIGTRAQYQLAAGLSFLLWGTTPDEELLAAARTGKLRTRDEVQAQARRLLGSPRAREGMAGFVEQLVDAPKYDLMEKDAAVHPEFGPELADEMRAEARAFGGHALVEDGKLETLLTAPYSFVGPRLAKLYGVTSADATKKTMLPARERAGLLTQAGLLAHTSPKSGTRPVGRGQFVLKTLLCTELTPPEDAMETLDATVAAADATTREKFELHTKRPDCAACHKLIDPIGFGLESYDAIGRYRTQERGRPVDARGVLYGTGAQDGPFTGAVELAARLAKSEKLHRCFVTQMFRYALGREDGQADQCVVDAVTSRMTANGLSVKEALLATVGSEAFLERARPAGR